MRVLVVDHDSTVLEGTVRALREHFVIDAVTNKADCMDLLRQNEFDIVVACERLEDGSGLELLSQIAKRWPATLRVFAADRERLRLLQGRLGPFELFQALSYPINPEKLLSTLSLAREAHDADADTTSIQHIVLSGDDPTEPGQASPPPEPARTMTARIPTRRQGVSASQSASAPARAPRSAGRPAPPPAFASPRRFDRAPTRPAIEPPAPAVAAPRPSSRRMARFAPLSDASDTSVMDESLAEAAGIAAAARSRLEATGETASRKAFIAGAGCVAALFAIGLIALQLRSKPRVAPPLAAPSAVQPQFSKAVADQVAEVEADFEQDNLRKAQKDIHELQALAPDHPRLRFFLSLLDRNIKARAAVAAAAPRERPGAAGKSESGRLESADSRRSAAASAGAGKPAAPSTADSPAVAKSESSRSESSQATVAAPTKPAGDASRSRPDSERGPVFVAGAPTTSVPILVAASAAPDEAAGTAPGALGTSAGTTGTRPTTVHTASDTAVEAPAASSSAANTAIVGPGKSPSSSAHQAISDAPPQAPARPSSTVPIVTAEAQLTHRVAPQYPDSALRKGIQGYVEVHFTITPQGTVTNVAVTSSDPADVFNRAATEAVRRWRYDPRVIDGRPVESQSQVRLQFKLDSSLSH